MDKSNQILFEVLDAREKRGELRSQYPNNEYGTLSLSLNIAGYPKSNPLIFSFFEEVLSELKPFLVANRIEVQLEKELMITDKAGDFYLVPFSITSKDTVKLKKITETFESTHTLGRLIDVDVFNEKGEPVSSGKKKPCYFCGEHSAVSCMRKKRHSYKEIREKLLDEVSKYLLKKHKEITINTITSYAVKAILFEISLSPKPGLVSFENTGSHADMNFFTFLNSSASLTPFFKEFCLLGYHYSGKYEDVLPQIREIGLRAEKDMFKATEGINTHKGVIFIFGIALFSIAKLMSEKEGYSDLEFRSVSKKICKGIVADELIPIRKQAITNGEKVFVKYGLVGAGVRNEVENGFPSIFQKASAHFDAYSNISNMNSQNEIQQILQTALLHIMAVNNDSNVLHRSDLKMLQKLQKLAIKALDNSNSYAELCDFCIEHKISPGGSADLLSVALLLHFVKTT